MRTGHFRGTTHHTRPVTGVNTFRRLGFFSYCKSLGSDPNKTIGVKPRFLLRCAPQRNAELATPAEPGQHAHQVLDGKAVEPVAREIGNVQLADT